MSRDVARWTAAGVFALWFRITVGRRRTADGWRVAHLHTSTPLHLDDTTRAATDLEPRPTRPPSGVSQPRRAATPASPYRRTSFGSAYGRATPADDHHFPAERVTTGDVYPTVAIRDDR